VLGEPDRQWLIWTSGNARFVPGRTGERWQVRAVAPETGRVDRQRTVDGAETLQLDRSSVWWLVRLPAVGS